MKKNTIYFIVGGLVILILFTVLVTWGVEYFFQPITIPTGGATFGSQTVLAEVERVVDQGQVDATTGSHPYQTLNVKVLEGEYRDIPFQVDYGKHEAHPADFHFAPGDKIYVIINQMPNKQLDANYVDYVRLKPMGILLGVFVLAILIMGRWKGLGSLISLGFSMVVIIYYVIPHILSGENPIKVSLIGSVILLGVTLYLTYGWNLKTHASVMSMMLSLLLTGMLSLLFVYFTRLTGYGDENTMFLMQLSSIQIDPRGLMLAGMIIGALGVLDDLVTSQSAAVVEIYDANPLLGFRSTIKKTMHIGEDHVAATVNTLVLAYTGASLPLLLLFTLGNGSYPYLINSEFLAEEIVRTLVGSLGLIAAVPISTFIATVLIVNQDRLGKWQVFLGSEAGDGESEHGHTH